MLAFQFPCNIIIGVTIVQAFKRWLPTLHDHDINVVLAKSSGVGELVNIISYDIAVKMAGELKKKGFNAVIIVSTMPHSPHVRFASLGVKSTEH